MWLIISLIFIGILLLIAELILLPGLSVAGIAGLISFIVATYIGFNSYGITGGIIVLVIIIALTTVAVILSLRARTWQRLSLKETIKSTSQPLPHTEVQIGDKGASVTRLAPMGNVEVRGKTYEAKSHGDIYIDQKKSIEVVGYENFNLVVKVSEEKAN